MFSFLSPYHGLADTISHFRIYILLSLIPLILFTFAIKLKYWRLLNTISFVIGFVSLSGVLYNWSALGNGTAKNGIKLLQLNLLYRNYKPSAVIKLVKELKPDVITFQELSYKNKHILNAIGKNYPHKIICFSSGIRSVAVLSRFPSASGKSKKCYRGKGLAWMQILVGGKKVSIASLHLKWPYPYGQPKHIDQLEGALKEIPKPVIASGDYNATPWSYAIDRIEQATNTKVIGGIRFTYRVDTYQWAWGERFPIRFKIRMPIDHILVSKEFSARKIRKERYVGSDHAPVIAEISLN